MAERRNGNRQFSSVRRTGSERRGSAATPREYLRATQDQSLRDRKELLERIRLRREEAQKRTDGLGNKSLPVFAHKAEIIETIESNKATVIGGATGSGKSTQVPQYLMEAGYDKTFVLVPRRVIANGLYERLGDELVEQLGDDARELVGVVHGERVEYDEEKNKIVVLTPQTFSKMEESIRETYGDSKIAIIADEIHEANLHSEIAAGIAGSSVRERDSWRLIASSATHDTAALAGPFSKINEDDTIPVIQIEGRPFFIDMREDAEHTPVELYAQIGHDYEKAMIFTSGKKEIDFVIEKTCREIEKQRRGSSRHVVFRKLHGELTEVELAQVNDPIPEGSRLVIVSSPAGNSGITIPGVQLVITDGTVNRAELDDEGTPGLIRRQASQAEIVQQMGRAGRDVAGGVGYLTKPVVYRDSEGKASEAHELSFLPLEERTEHAPADIYSTRLGRTALEVAGIGRRFADINPYLPHAVEFTDIAQAEELLSRIGALNKDGVITSVGQEMNRFALSPELARGVVEVRRQGRTQQQIARVALIAAAIEIGGLQDFTDSNRDGWKRLVSEDSNDDYSAQLELFLSAGPTQYGEGVEWLREHDLHPKRVQQARKLAAKIMGAFKMDINNITFSPINHDEQRELFRDMTAGMIDLVYERAGRNRRKEALYRNIHGEQHSTHRVISRRSMMSDQAALLAGLPRWYLNKQGRTEHILELGFPVDEAHVAAFAREHDILGARMLPPAMKDGRVVEVEQPSFGSINVGAPRIRGAAENIPRTSQELLLSELNKKPGRQQRSLIDLAKRLQMYKERLPEGEFEGYLRQGHPEIITVASVQNMLKEYVGQYRSQGEIEEKIRERIYHERISLNEYLYHDAVLAIQRRIPNELKVVDLGSTHRLQYDGSTPYITNLSPSQYKKLTTPLYLPDEREVLIQIKKPGDRGTMRVSVLALRELVQ